MLLSPYTVIFGPHFGNTQPYSFVCCPSPSKVFYQLCWLYNRASKCTSEICQKAPKSFRGRPQLPLFLADCSEMPTNFRQNRQKRQLCAGFIVLSDTIREEHRSMVPSERTWQRSAGERPFSRASLSCSLRWHHGTVFLSYGIGKYDEASAQLPFLSVLPKVGWHLWTICQKQRQLRSASERFWCFLTDFTCAFWCSVV